jgi:hypothetical protein
VLNELKTEITAFIRNISQVDLRKIFANKIKRVQGCIDARGHHFQRLLLLHSDFSNALGLGTKVLVNAGTGQCANVWTFRWTKAKH